MNEKSKTKCLFKILETTATGRVIVFIRTKHRAKRVAADLDNKDYKVAALQGNLSQNKRNIAINGFKNGKYDILVATDIASRGIDVSQVSHVINFDIPNTVDAYIHRIGRTGRAKQKGEALTFVLPEDEFMVRRIENVLKSKIDRRIIEDIDYGKKDVSSSKPNGYRGSDRSSQQKRQRRGRYNGVSKAARSSEEGRPSTKSYGNRKKPNNYPVNSSRDTSSGKRSRSR